MRKMRGVIDPYTLGILISLIGTASAYIAHGNKQTDVAIESSVHMEKQAVATTQTENYNKFIDCPNMSRANPLDSALPRNAEHYHKGDYVTNITS